MRYVPKEEDQMRRKNAQVLPLHQLQDGMHFHTSREEAESTQRVRIQICIERTESDPGRAKYIEGLENRLGRMESLLRLSGLLSEEDGGKTDLGTLEKRLADRTNALNAAKSSNKFMAQVTQAPQAAPQQGPGSHQTTPRMDSHSSPQTAATSPDSPKSETEVEALSDMMCSLVTNNCGETRYIGTFIPHGRGLRAVY